MSYLKEGQRRPGSEWMKDHPRALEAFYQATERMLPWVYPVLKRVSSRWTERFLIWSEKSFKGYIFNCQMCGQCLLHSTGMTCTMNCPKNLRNGPCGGVRADGHCEVIPEQPCIWVQVWERSRAMAAYQDEILLINPPVNRSLANTSAWINMLEGIDRQTPVGWDD
jgi:hypothetical protein